MKHTLYSLGLVIGAISLTQSQADFAAKEGSGVAEMRGAIRSKAPSTWR